MSVPTQASRWRDLAASAVIGTDRSGGAVGPSEVLTLAAVLGATSRAGLRPARLAGRVPSCPVDQRPVAGAAAMATLTRLLSDPDAGLIEEWATLAHAKGVRVVDGVVPVLLDWWARQPRRARFVFSVLGTRGVWLSSLNDAWRRPVAGDEVPPDTDDLWQTGRASERAALLVTVRAHDPARALELVRSTWESDGADERRAFVEALREGASMADEPFLEGALDDKSKVVRREAAGVLGAIAGSRLVARMNERAKGMIVVEKKRGLLKRGVKVSLQPPAEFAAEWARDGIEERVGTGTGKRSWWMRQILSLVELSVWTELTGLEPQGVLEALSTDDFFEDALQAMVLAAGRTTDSLWRTALLRHLLAREIPNLQMLQGLWAGLAQAKSEELLLEAARHAKLGAADRLAMLATSEHRWTRKFSVEALRLVRADKPKASDSWRLLDGVERVSRLVAPESADLFEETVVAMFPDEPTKGFRKSIDRVRLRSDMHKEFLA